LKISAANLCPFGGIEEFAGFANFDEIELSQLIPEVIVEEILNYILLILCHFTADEVHSTD
jgi:hypothetical protein